MKGGPTAEPRPMQRVIMMGASLGFIGLLVLPALDCCDRHRKTSVPLRGALHEGLHADTLLHRLRNAWRA